MTRGDWLVLMFALMTLPALYASVWRDATVGDEALILVNGQTVQRVNLHREQTITVHGERGDAVLAVADGAIRFLNSSCSGKQCVHQGWLRHGGEFAACLPNRVSVQVLAQQSRYDSLNF